MSAFVNEFIRDFHSRSPGNAKEEEVSCYVWSNVNQMPALLMQKMTNPLHHFLSNSVFTQQYTSIRADSWQRSDSAVDVLWFSEQSPQISAFTLTVVREQSAPKHLLNAQTDRVHKIVVEYNWCCGSKAEPEPNIIELYIWYIHDDEDTTKLFYVKCPHTVQ